MSATITEVDTSNDEDFIASIFGLLLQILVIRNVSFSDGDASISWISQTCLIEVYADNKGGLLALGHLFDVHFSHVLTVYKL